MSRKVGKWNSTRRGGASTSDPERPRGLQSGGGIREKAVGLQQSILPRARAFYFSEGPEPPGKSWKQRRGKQMQPGSASPSVGCASLLPPKSHQPALFMQLWVEQLKEGGHGTCSFSWKVILKIPSQSL